MFINRLVGNNVVLVQHSHGISVYGARDSIIINNIASDPEGQFPAWISLGETSDWEPGVPIDTGIWTHVAFTYDGSTMKMYKDGVNVVSAHGSGSLMLADPSSGESFLVGANTKWGKYFSGVSTKCAYITGS
jgi:hypothetical protein